MPPPDFDRIRELTRRLDELCREAAAIREELAKAADQRASWPVRSRVTSSVTKSIIPSDFLPTSTVESVN
jgi:hypothetical protein